MVRKDPNGTAFELTGPKGAPVVVFIHGLGLCRRMWDGLLPAFSKYRVLNYDLYGHGDSAPLPTKASLKVYADQLGWLMDDLEIAQAHIVGFSIGGMINRRFAMDYPDETASLVILNAPHNRGDAAQAQVEARAKTVKEQGAMATIEPALERWFTPEHLANGTGPKQVRHWRATVDTDSYAQAAWVLANGVRELINPTPAIAKPTLIMTCENDSGSTPDMSQAIAREIENATIQIIPKLQHLGVLEDPNPFSKSILEHLQNSTR